MANTQRLSRAIACLAVCLLATAGLSQTVKSLAHLTYDDAQGGVLRVVRTPPGGGAADAQQSLGHLDRGMVTVSWRQTMERYAQGPTQPNLETLYTVRFLNSNGQLFFHVGLLGAKQGEGGPIIATGASGELGRWKPGQELEFSVAMNLDANTCTVSIDGAVRARDIPVKRPGALNYVQFRDGTSLGLQDGAFSLTLDDIEVTHRPELNRQEPPVARPAPALAPVGDAASYRTCWIGNSFGGADQTWVQGRIHDAWVSPEGAVFATTWWDEGGHEQCAYKDGRLLGVIGKPGHRDGGWTVAIAGSGDALFGCSGIDDHVQIRRFDISALRKPGAAGRLSFPQTEVTKLSARKPVWGLLCLGDQVFASVPEENKVYRIKIADLSERGSFPARGPSKLAAAPDGTLWIVEGWNGMGGTSVGHFKADGTRLPETIDDIEEIRAIAWSASRNCLLLGENGKANCMLSYDVTGKPKRVGSFGRPYAAGKPGQVAPDKFDGITGLGTDAAGNLYVCSDGRAGADGNGTVLRSFAGDGKTLNWELLGLEFVDTADIDPASDGADVYSDFHHYRLDADAPAGKDSTWQGLTFDRFHASQANDFRASTKHHYVLGVRRIQGKLFMFTTAQWPHYMSIYRFEGEQAIPCGRWIGQHEPKQPWAVFPGEEVPAELKGKMIGSFWTDADADGLVQAGEIEATEPTWCWGRHVDESGGVWHVFGSGIMYFPCDGLNKAGAPVYAWSKRKWHERPSELSAMSGCAYQAASDTMLTLGWTATVPRTDWDDRAVGRVLACYTDWSKPVRKLAWSTPLAVSDGGALDADYIGGVAVAGSYAFVGVTDRKRNLGFCAAYALADSMLAQRFTPGPEVGGVNGWLDIPNPIHAYRRLNGEYMVLLEEDALHKVILYRWRPAVVVLAGLESVKRLPGGKVRLAEGRPGDRERVVQSSVRSGTP